MSGPSVMHQILDLARWAPSGDNTQCWRFEIIAPDHVAVHGYDTREHCVYDLDGHPSQISYGALLETLALAASGHGMRADIVRRSGTPEEKPVFDVRLERDPAITPSPLIPAITRRSVQRRPLRTRPLTATEKAALEEAVGEHYSVTWLEGTRVKLRTARLMFNNARLRLSMPEAYETHRKIIHWGVTHSPDRVPDQALGVDAMTLKMMKWAMVRWGRLSTMNRVMGTWAPRLQMDFVPGVACAAHFVLKAKRQPQSIDDYVQAGRAVQRFWLTLTHLGLHMQPEMTPLIFSKYVRENVKFTDTMPLHGMAAKLERETARLIFNDAGFPVYMGRLGAGKAPTSRSERKPLEELLK
ncbi:molybdopterin biosynthesis protein MoeY [Massilia sp. PAMC28688]|uniref:molybdopterin biosynthesis protein MoeY n=1 Tax=Massilia sp. PAMC28688 TaxID=2861283 RepID=UPI001C6300DD|nr:molybdopterin biosynthesis protein MoeY [Massilia sp. PAMC28688]QYF95044.1 molybdopterin biosynthesis protein MoeY [Massilia sp. PAMC28688]